MRKETEQKVADVIIGLLLVAALFFILARCSHKSTVFHPKRVQKVIIVVHSPSPAVPVKPSIPAVPVQPAPARPVPTLPPSPMRHHDQSAPFPSPVGPHCDKKTCKPVHKMHHKSSALKPSHRHRMYRKYHQPSSTLPGNCPVKVGDLVP